MFVIVAAVTNRRSKTNRLVHDYTPETKQQSRQWTKPGEQSKDFSQPGQRWRFVFRIFRTLF